MNIIYKLTNFKIDKHDKKIIILKKKKEKWGYLLSQNIKKELFTTNT